MKTFNFSKKFITFEGIEGSGKTTNLNYLAEILREKGINVTVTREPGGTKMGEEIRKILLANHKETVCAITEILLLFAARSQHIENIIRPALIAGNCVLSDRFTDASYAYQGGGRGIALQTIQFLENLVQKDLRPDLTIVFDIPVELSVERIKKRKSIDRIEQEKVDFFERVRQAYLDRAKSLPERYAIIDATKPLTVVHKELEDLFCL
jgi:dTMP kinase